MQTIKSGSRIIDIASLDETKDEARLKTFNVEIDFNATSKGIGGGLIGEISITYAKLKSILGEPSFDTDKYKVDAEWRGTIDGEIFTIYNWKDGKNYLGAEGKAVEEITSWHIGGRKTKTAEKIAKLLDVPLLSR